MMMFRKIPLLVVLLVLVALSSATLLAQEPVTLRFSSFQSGAVVEKWEEQFAEFEAATGIKIVHEFVPWPETVERYLTMAAGDDLPDVAMVSAQWHRTLATRGVLSELTQDQFEVLDLDDFWPRLLGAYNYDGVQYGLPTDLDLQLIY
jgi:ABC-type glycerol-3-phosphate transport system substrate-binding protein